VRGREESSAQGKGGGAVLRERINAKPDKAPPPIINNVSNVNSVEGSKRERLSALHLRTLTLLCSDDDSDDEDEY
jgi:hypothetical protein